MLEHAPAAIFMIHGYVYAFGESVEGHSTDRLTECLMIGVYSDKRTPEQEVRSAIKCRRKFFQQVQRWAYATFAV